LADVTSQSLQNFANDYSGNCEGLSLCNHAAEFFAGTTWKRAEKIYPDGTINQYQTRFLRAAFKSPFQTPLP